MINLPFALKLANGCQELPKFTATMKRCLEFDISAICYA